MWLPRQVEMSCPGSSNSSRIQLLRSAACTIRFKGSRQQRSDYCGTGFRCQSSYKSTVRYLTSRPAPNKVAIHAKGRNGKNLSWAKCCFCIGVRRGPKQNLTLPTTSSPRAPLMAYRFERGIYSSLCLMHRRDVWILCGAYRRPEVF